MLLEERKIIYDYLLLQGLATSGIRNYHFRKYNLELIKDVKKLISNDLLTNYFDHLGELISDHQFLFSLRECTPSRDPLYHNQVVENFNLDSVVLQETRYDTETKQKALSDFSELIQYNSHPLKLTFFSERVRLFSSIKEEHIELFDLYYLLQLPQDIHGGSFSYDFFHYFSDEQKLNYNDKPFLSKNKNPRAYSKFSDFVYDFIQSQLFLGELKFYTYTYDFNKALDYLLENSNFISNYILEQKTGFYKLFVNELSQLKGYCDLTNTDYSLCNKLFEKFSIEPSKKKLSIKINTVGQLDTAYENNLIDQKNFKQGQKRFQNKFEDTSEFESSYLYKLITLRSEKSASDISEEDIIDFIFYDKEIDQSFDFTSSYAVIEKYYSKLIHKAISGELSLNDFISLTEKLWTSEATYFWEINKAFLFTIDFLNPTETVRWLFKSSRYLGNYGVDEQLIYSLFKAGYKTITNKDFYLNYIDDAIVQDSPTEFEKFLTTRPEYIFDVGEFIAPFFDISYLFEHSVQLSEEYRLHSISNWNIDPDNKERFENFNDYIFDKTKLLELYEHVDSPNPLFKPKSDLVNQEIQIEYLKHNPPTRKGTRHITSSVIDMKLDKIISNLVEEYYQFLGISNIRWKSEYSLYLNIKETFKDRLIQFQARPKWLGQQSFDIYFPIEKIAIEYNGHQHYEPIEFFGGEQVYRETLERDQRKKVLAEENNCKLVIHKFDESLEQTTKKIETLLNNL